MKVKDKFDDQLYAVKKVRLHLAIDDDLLLQLKNHRMFREVFALSKYKSTELKHLVRYFNSWLEELT